MSLNGYFGKLLEVDLTSGQISKLSIPDNDLRNYLGGRGLGVKLLWDRLEQPGVDPLSPENPIMYLPGPFSGFQIPSSPRMCIVTKSPRTSPAHSEYEHASTVSYSNIGGFFAPELRFAGYDGILVTGKSEQPVMIVIEDEKVEIRDASKFWGMGTDQFDQTIYHELGDRKFETLCIGPAGENLVPMSSILHTAARAAGRGGTGCVMGSKNLKAIAVKGTKMPDVAYHKEYLDLLEKIRQSFMEENESLKRWRYGGTANDP